MRSRLDEDTETFIDALRGLAALGVLITHAVDIALAGIYGSSLVATPLPWRWVRASLGHGEFLVWCFFVISGLCIHQSISRSVTSGSFCWKRYFAARVTRIYPLFLLGLLLAILVWWFTDPLRNSPASRPWPQFFASLVSLQIFTSTFPAYDPSWSLSNEMIYYFVWPGSLLLFRRRPRAAAIFLLTGCLAAAAVILSLWMVLHRLEHSALVRGMWTVIILFPVWLSGAWLGAAWKKQRMRISLNDWLWSIPLCGASELWLVILKFFGSPEWAVDLAGLFSIPGLVILIAGAHHARMGSSEWVKSMACWFGQFSYPCYVLHLQMMFFLDRNVLTRVGGAYTANPILRSLLLAVPVLVSLALVGPWIERGVMNWRGRLLARMQSG